MAPTASRRAVLRWYRPWTGLAALVAGLPITLPWFLRWAANRWLKRQSSIGGQVGPVSLDWVAGSLRCRNITFVTLGDGPSTAIRIASISIRLSWAELLRRRLSVSIDIEGPRVLAALPVAPAEESRRPKPASGNSNELASDAYRRFIGRLRALPPARIERLRVRNGRVHLQRVPGEAGTDVRIEDVAVDARNIHNRESIWTSPMAVVAAAGQIMGTGRFRLQLDAYPMENAPTLQMTAKVEKLFLPELSGLFRALAAAEITAGRLDVYSEASAALGRFDGYVKPIATGLETAPVEGASGKERFKGHLTRLAVSLLRNRNEGRLATQFDFSGTLDHPVVDVWSALKRGLRNAFGHAIRHGFTGDTGLFDLAKDASAAENPS